MFLKELPGFLMQLEGIIVHKTVYKERDLICKLLLRDGNLASVYFYGGKGGGTKKKGSILELGFMIKVTLSPRRNKLDRDIQIAKEWDLLWESKKIRENYKAFYLMSFYSEFLQKVAPQKDFSFDDSSSENEGIFKVASNALYFLEQSLNQGDFQPAGHLLMFLTKMTYQLGVVPDLGHCVHCYTPIDKLPLILFQPNNGGFSCNECSSSINQVESDSAKELRDLALKILETSYKDWEQIKTAERGPCEAIFHFLCHQFHWQPGNFISYQMVF